MSDLTLVVASYNHEDLIPRALESVAAQTERPRLIVTDDASKDRSQEVIISELNRLGLEAETIFHIENAGICKTFNEALALVQTPMVAFISADDWMEPTRVEEHAAALSSADDDVALVYGDVFVDFADGSPGTTFAEHGWPKNLGAEGDVYLKALAEYLFPTPSVVMRTHAIRLVGGYDENLSVEDFDMWMRLAQKYRVMYHPKPLVHYWQHTNNLSKSIGGTNHRYVQDRLRAYKKHLDGSREAVAIVSDKIYDSVRALWRLGENPRRFAPHLWRQTLLKRSPKAALLTVAAVLGMPGDIVFGVRNLPPERSL